MALVGNKEPNELKIWDAITNCELRSIKLSSTIKSIKLRTDMYQIISYYIRIAIGVDTKILLYCFPECKMIDCIDTLAMWNGIFDINTGDEAKVLVSPHKNIGFVHIKFFNVDITKEKVFIYRTNSKKIISLALSRNGALLATTSSYGSVIKIFKTETGELLQELRRGSNKSQISQLLFHSSNKYLACVSNKETIHIFLLNQPNSNGFPSLNLDPNIKNKTSK